MAVLSLTASACGTGTSPTPDAALIATSAARTVEARFTQFAVQTSVASTPPSPAPGSDSTPVTPTVFTPAPSPTYDPNAVACLSANYIADVTIPDGTIIRPGEAFTKTWRVKNNGSCTWDSTYALEFSNGESMGSQYSYPLPQAVVPGGVLDLSIQLVAPETEGVYTGYWLMRTPFGGSLGFGGTYQPMSPLSVQINVSNTKKFSITSVSYVVVRNPTSGCPANVRFAVTATITVNGPMTVTYEWIRSDGEPYGQSPKSLIFEEAGSKTVKGEWAIHRGAVAKTRWLAVQIDSPGTRLYQGGEFYFDCQ